MVVAIFMNFGIMIVIVSGNIIVCIRYRLADLLLFYGHFSKIQIATAFFIKILYRGGKAYREQQEKNIKCYQYF